MDMTDNQLARFIADLDGRIERLERVADSMAESATVSNDFLSYALKSGGSRDLVERFDRLAREVRRLIVINSVTMLLVIIAALLLS